MSAEPFITSLAVTSDASRSCADLWAITSTLGRMHSQNSLNIGQNCPCRFLAVRGEDTHRAPRRSNALCHCTLYRHTNLWWCQHFPAGGLRALHSGWRGRSSGLTRGAHTFDFLVFVPVGAELSISWTDGLISLLFPPITAAFCFIPFSQVNNVFFPLSRGKQSLFSPDLLHLWIAR